MLMMVMSGTAISVLLASQTDLNLSGVTREQQMALYAAEYGVARAKSLIASQTLLPPWNATSGWNPLLTTTDPTLLAALCDPVVGVPLAGATPGLMPKAAHPISLFYTLTDKSGNPAPQGQGQDVSWNFCIHNNADDPGYLNPTVVGVYTGNTDDSRDSQHLIVIEAYGYAPNGAFVQLSVTTGNPSMNATGGTGSYAQEAAGSQHTGESGAGEAGITVTSGSVQRF